MRLSLFAVLLLAGLQRGSSSRRRCAATRWTRIQLKELHAGVSTRADVTSVLGSPTARAAFDDNTWLYVEETRPRIGATQAMLDQKVVELTFDQAGVLRGHAPARSRRTRCR